MRWRKQERRSARSPSSAAKSTCLHVPDGTCLPVSLAPAFLCPPVLVTPVSLCLPVPNGTCLPVPLAPACLCLPVPGQTLHIPGRLLTLAHTQRTSTSPMCSRTSLHEISSLVLKQSHPNPSTSSTRGLRTHPGDSSQRHFLLRIFSSLCFPSTPAVLHLVILLQESQSCHSSLWWAPASPSPMANYRDQKYK